MHSEVEQGYSVFIVNIIEFMLSDSTILQGLTEIQQTELFARTQDMVNLKEDFEYVFGRGGIISSLFLLSHILNASNNNDWKEFCSRNKDN